MSAAATGFIGRFRVSGVVKALFAAQAALAVALVWHDVTGWRGTSDIEPAVFTPPAPGDQTRRYDPAAVPTRAPGAAPRRGGYQAPPEMGPMTFRFFDDEELGRVMALEGSIRPGDAARFATALEEAAPQPDALTLHSPGGSVLDAIEIGAAVRAAGMNTVMLAEAACASACPLILFGGVERIVSRKAWVGLHQSYLMDVTLVTTRQAVSEVQQVQSLMLAHTDKMGVDPAVHVHAFATPPERIYYLVEDELTDYAVATELTD